MQEQEPGQVILPRSDAPEPLSPAVSEVPVTSPSPQTASPLSVPTSSPSVVSSPASPSLTPPSASHNEPSVDTVSSPTLPEQGTPVSQPSDSEAMVTWRANEFADTTRTLSWYGMSILAAALLSVVVYFLNHDLLTALLVFIALAGLSVAMARKPREQAYMVDDSAISVGQKQYLLQDFHSFSLDEEPTASSIILRPLKRFMPAVTVYVPMEYETQVVAILSGVLPMEQHKPDVLEKLLKRFHL